MMEYNTDMKMNYVQIHVRKVCHTVKQISQHERIHTFDSNNIMYKKQTSLICALRSPDSGYPWETTTGRQQ